LSKTTKLLPRARLSLRGGCDASRDRNDPVTDLTRRDSDFLLYAAPDGAVKVRVLLKDETAWLTQNEFPNLTVNKIPRAVFSRCEWGRDDYSLNVTEQTLVIAVEKETAKISTRFEHKANAPKMKLGARRKKEPVMQELPLFANLEKEGFSQ
jgi:hypothetical protein